MRNISSTDLVVHPLCLGGNVFGWTADEAQSFAVLDAYAAAGGNFVDTADGYSQWVPGHRGGESEEIIGRWMAKRGNRDGIVLATKVGSKHDRKGLAAANVRAATEESLRRLQTDRIDLLYTHRDDEVTAPEETLAALDELVREGKVRHVAASNVSPARLEEAMAASERVLAALDAAAAAHEVPVAAASLAWLAAQPTVVAPIASARTPEQLAELMAMAGLELSADELRALDEAGT